MALCLIGAGETIRIAATVFTLSWIHTVEKMPWQETWRIEPARLMLTEARVKGSGAGMEPAENARREDGWYVWEPENGARAQIVLRTNAVSHWTFCAEDVPCAPIERVLGRAADPITLKPCA